MPDYKVKQNPELHREREPAQDHTVRGLGVRGSRQSGCADRPGRGLHSQLWAVCSSRGGSAHPAAVMGISCHRGLCPLPPSWSRLPWAPEPTPLRYLASCQQDSSSRSFWALWPCHSLPARGPAGTLASRRLPSCQVASHALQRGCARPGTSCHQLTDTESSISGLRHWVGEGLLQGHGTGLPWTTS